MSSNITSIFNLNRQIAGVLLFLFYCSFFSRISTINNMQTILYDLKYSYGVFALSLSLSRARVCVTLNSFSFRFVCYFSFVMLSVIYTFSLEHFAYCIHTLDRHQIATTMPVSLLVIWVFTPYSLRFFIFKYQQNH